MEIQIHIKEVNKGCGASFNEFDKAIQYLEEAKKIAQNSNNIIKTNQMGTYIELDTAKQYKEHFLQNFAPLSTLSLGRISAIYDEVLLIFRDGNKQYDSEEEVQKESIKCINRMKKAAKNKEEMFVYTSVLSYSSSIS